MKILGLDTSSKYLCLGVSADGSLFEYRVEAQRKLSRLTTPTIQRVLDCLGYSVSDVDYFACGLGPGSFTGVRVGLATIKALSWVARKPVVGISSLDILALNAVNHSGYVIPLIDAKRDLFYTSIYRLKGRALKRVAPYMLLTKEEFLQKSKPGALFLGDGLMFLKEEIQRRIKQAVVLDKDYWYPQACHIIQRAREEIIQKRMNNPFDIKPIYLYPKECQIKPRLKV